MANTATATRKSVKAKINMGVNENGKTRYVTRSVADATFDEYAHMWFGQVIVDGAVRYVSRRAHSRFWRLDQ